jgi:hypothetical protein
MDWLALSRAELMRHRSMEEVLGSLELSMLTRPNEGYVMGERAVFALSLWDKLPADLKRHAAIEMMFPRTPAEGEIQEKMCKDPANGNQQQVAAWDGSKGN